MNVIFLDVDGVLNSEDFLRKREEEHRQLGHEGPAFPRRETKCDCFRLDRQIDPVAIAHLNDLVEETAAKIVISSSWRKLFDPPELHRILAAHGLVVVLAELLLADVAVVALELLLGHQLDAEVGRLLLAAGSTQRSIAS